MKTKFSERIKALRKAAGETQVELAGRVGITQAGLSSLESGKFNASKYTAQIADHYRVNALWLATGEGSREAISATLDSEEFTRIYLSLAEDKRKLLLAVGKSMQSQ